MSLVLIQTVGTDFRGVLRRADLSEGTKLNIDDLLAPLAESSSTLALASLQKSVKTLRPPSPSTSKGKGKAGPVAASSKSKKPRTLAAPLPQRTQERLDREAAYEQTKTEVDKWSDSMKRIKDVSTTPRLGSSVVSELVRSSGGTSELPSATGAKDCHIQPRTSGSLQTENGARIGHI